MIKATMLSLCLTGLYSSARAEAVTFDGPKDPVVQISERNSTPNAPIHYPRGGRPGGPPVVVLLSCGADGVGSRRLQIIWYRFEGRTSGQVNLGPSHRVDLICNNAAELMRANKNLKCTGIDSDDSVVTIDVQRVGDGYRWEGQACR